MNVNERQRQMGHPLRAIDGSVAEAGRRLQAWLDVQHGQGDRVSFAPPAAEEQGIGTILLLALAGVIDLF